ncbi:MAG TPA: hypothetical protein VKB78_05670 [Pirellulales bacterium]|nr:hypothetical protein [Pirellulales bacterium]
MPDEATWVEAVQTSRRPNILCDRGLPMLVIPGEFLESEEREAQQFAQMSRAGA